MYAFFTGPGLWIAFTIFIIGFVARIAFLFGLSRERDRVIYNHVSLAWAMKSIFHWLVPWGSRSMRQQPIFTLMFFVFHICLLATPIFLSAHNVLWEESFGWAPWSMPDTVADGLSILLPICGIYLLLRRLIRPEVRILSSFWDFLLILFTMIPFITGIFAYHQWGPYDTLLLLHIISAELLLILIPFSKLGHMVLFFFTRAFIGFEMGGRRGARSW
jgi:nitrate reductase gamma subunit